MKWVVNCGTCGMVPLELESIDQLPQKAEEHHQSDHHLYLFRLRKVWKDATTERTS